MYLSILSSVGILYLSPATCMDHDNIPEYFTDIFRFPFHLSPHTFYNNNNHNNLSFFSVQKLLQQVIIIVIIRKNEDIIIPDRIKK